jgi:hypothetical protein
VDLTVEGYLQYDYANNFLATIAEDFVVSADITWNTQYGTSGCGFAVRSNGDTEALDQYLVVATRGGSGRVIFSIMAQGEIANAKDIYAYGIDPAFEWLNDATNRLTVIGRASTITLYTNETLIGEFDVNEPPQQPYIPPAPTPPPDMDTNAEAASVYQGAKVAYDQTVAQIQAEFRNRSAAFEAYGTEFDRGFIAMVALSESGTTHCQFDNAWLWLIEE